MTKLSQEQKVRAVRYFVDTVFMPELTRKLVLFLDDFKNKILYTESYRQATGYHISVEKPSVLDLKDEQDKLVSNLVTLINSIER